MSEAAPGGSRMRAVGAPGDLDCARAWPDRRCGRSHAVAMPRQSCRSLAGRGAGVDRSRTVASSILPRCCIVMLLEQARASLRRAAQGDCGDQDAGGHRAAAERAASVLSGVARRPARANVRSTRRSSGRSSATAIVSRKLFSRAGRSTTSRPICTCRTGKPPFPGVLLPCGHGDNGKAYESYQRMGILLAKNGMAVLLLRPDRPGRAIPASGSSGKPVIRGTTEHTMAGIGALLVGRQLASYRIWDGFRALDYLAGRPEVDPTRLGCTGNSGGGTMTAYLMALDDRISVARALVLHHVARTALRHDRAAGRRAEHHRPGRRGHGARRLHHDARAQADAACRSALATFSTSAGSWDTFREVKLIYGRLGFGERVDLFESDEEHGFTKPRRVATARWMRRWLLKQDEPIDEPDFPIATDAELQCTRSGQVLLISRAFRCLTVRWREQELRKAESRTACG